MVGYSSEITAASVAKILEIIKQINPSIKYFQPCSSNMFGISEDKTQNENTKFNPQKSLKIFFIKLISISIVIIIIINLSFNLIFADRLEKIDKILLFNKSEFRNEMKEKVRKELNDGLKKRIFDFRRR